MPYVRRRYSRATRRPSARRRVTRGAYRRKRAPARRTGYLRRVLNLAAGFDLPKNIGTHMITGTATPAQHRPADDGYAAFQARTSTPEYFLQAAEVHMPGYEATASWIPNNIKRAINFNPAVYKDAIWAMKTGAQIGAFAGWTVPELLASEGAAWALGNAKTLVDIYGKFYSGSGTPGVANLARAVPTYAEFLKKLANAPKQFTASAPSFFKLAKNTPLPDLNPLPIMNEIPTTDWTDYINLHAHEQVPIQPAWMDEVLNRQYLSQGI
nr:hypothetical protein [Crucivirus sp.]